MSTLLSVGPMLGTMSVTVGPSGDGDGVVGVPPQAAVSITSIQAPTMP
jgi:hypothetical protein